MILPHNPEIVDDISSQDWLDGMRHHRNRLLAESDWTQIADAPVDKAAWAAYRQELRDFPATWTPGPTANFPNPPGDNTK